MAKVYLQHEPNVFGAYVRETKDGALHIIIPCRFCDAISITQIIKPVQYRVGTYRGNDIL